MAGPEGVRFHNGTQSVLIMIVQCVLICALLRGFQYLCSEQHIRCMAVIIMYGVHTKGEVAKSLGNQARGV